MSKGHILPCRYCGAPTYMEGVDPVTIHNSDGTLHECHEMDRAKAIHTIFWGQVEDACYPLTPDEVLERLRGLFDYYASTCLMGDEEKDLHSLGAAIDVVKLVTGVKGGKQ